MRACLMLAVVSALVSAVCGDCDACIYGFCYKKHLLPGVARGGPMAIDSNSNILYASNWDLIKQCSIDTMTCNNITKIGHLRDLTVNPHTGDVYAIDNTTFSIYKLDLINNKKELLVSSKVMPQTESLRVMRIVFKDKLYYSLGDSRGIFTYENGVSRVVTKDYGTHHFIVDKNDDIYFEYYTKSTKKTVIKRLSKGVVNQTEFWDYGRHMTIDKDGNTMLFDPESHTVYRLTNGHQDIVGVVNELKYHSTPLFDKDNNLIYKLLKNNKIYVLKQERDQCVTSISEKISIITKSVDNTKTNEKTKSSFSSSNTEFTPSSFPDKSGGNISGIYEKQTDEEQDDPDMCSCLCILNCPK